MKNGLYKYTDDGILGGGHVIIDVTEKEKSYVFKLIENTCRFDPWRISSLFKNSEKTIIKKSNSKHAVRDYTDSFVIYPYKDGIPYYFKSIEREA